MCKMALKALLRLKLTDKLLIQMLLVSGFSNSQKTSFPMRWIKTSQRQNKSPNPSHLFYFCHFQLSPPDFKEIWQICYYMTSSRISLSFYLEESLETKTFASTTHRTTTAHSSMPSCVSKHRSEGSCQKSNYKRTALQGPSTSHSDQPWPHHITASHPVPTAPEYLLWSVRW